MMVKLQFDIDTHKLQFPNFNPIQVGKDSLGLQRKIYVFPYLSIIGKFPIQYS